jgi:hypothetical protein
MKAASHVPSGVLTSTFVSVMGKSSAEAEPVAAITPAASDNVTNSRRDKVESLSIIDSLPSLTSDNARLNRELVATLLVSL